MKLKIREAAAAAGVPLVDPYPELVAASPRGIPDSTMFTDAFHPQSKTNAVLARAILAAIADGKAIPTIAAGPEALARARAAIDAIADKTEVYGDRQLQLSVYREDYKKRSRSPSAARSRICSGWN